MAPPGRVLTQRQLNRAVLARQLLLGRGGLSLPRALERIGALQTQYAPSGYVGLWSRVEGFERDALTRALARRHVVQATLMRNTIHLTSPQDYWPLVLAIRGERMAWSRRVQKAEPRTMEWAATRLREVLADGPRRQAEIVAALGDEVWRPGIAIWVDLVRVPPSGTWERRRADLFGLAEDWVGPAPELSEQEAVEHLVRRYLGAFGPAPKEDIADWAGMRLGAIAPALERLRLRRFRDEQGRELLDSSARRCRRRTRQLRSGSSPPGTRRCSCTPAGAASCPSGTGRASSTSRRRTRSRPSWSTARSPEPGATRTGA